MPHTPLDRDAKRSGLRKLREWTRRYAPLEAVSVLTALAGGTAAAGLATDPVLIAYAAAWSENIGYYGLAFGRELRGSAAGASPAPMSSHAIRAARNLIWEFGAAELLDSFVVRPLAMFAATNIISNLQGGILAGKLAADAVFYAVAIVFYEKGKPRS